MLEKKSPSKLHKLVHATATYEKRVFVLEAGHLKYYKGPDPSVVPSNRTLKGDLDLALTESIELGHGKKHNDEGELIPDHLTLSVAGHIYHLKAKTPEEAQAWLTILQETFELCARTYEMSVEMQNVVFDIHGTRNPDLTELKPRLDAAIANCEKFGFLDADMQSALKTQALVNKAVRFGTGPLAPEPEVEPSRSRKFSTAFREATAEEKAAILNARTDSVIHEVLEEEEGAC